VTDDYVAEVKKQMPPLPNELYNKYVEDLKLNDYDASVLTDEKEVALYFEEVIAVTDHYKAAANWVMGPVKSYLNDKAISIAEFPVPPQSIASLIEMIDKGETNFSVASQKIFPELISNPGEAPGEIASRKNLIQESGEDAIMEFVHRALEKFPDKVKEYKGGKKGVIGLFMGEVMKQSKGKIDPKKANELLRKELEK
jgi:aspartyl-tRNA(Asn)/glutamyl-tRNA(Gln) amidotransferase subunit B